jgi:hypothetical protein
MTLSFITTPLRPMSYYNGFRTSKDKQTYGGKRKHVPLKIPQKPEVIIRLQSDGSQSVVTASYNTGPSTIIQRYRRTKVYGIK